jgi:hypothetical protein
LHQLLDRTCATTTWTFVAQMHACLEPGTEISNTVN